MNPDDCTDEVVIDCMSEAQAAVAEAEAQMQAVQWRIAAELLDRQRKRDAAQAVLDQYPYLQTLLDGLGLALG